jgi:acetyl/propionyl-CoA carboxylase alpha subunit
VPDCYDSLLGKIIAWGRNREEATARLAAALRATYSAGVHTNERWLARVLESPRFVKVRHSIALLDTSAAEFAGSATPPPEVLVLAALAAHEGEAARPATPSPAPGIAMSPWDLRDAFTPNLPALIPYSLSWRGQTYAVELEYSGGRPTAATVAGRTRVALNGVTAQDGSIAAQVEARRHQARYQLAGAHVYLWTADEQYDLLLEDPRTREFSASAVSGGLTTPLPGVVVSVPVAVGQKVTAGEVLMVIEAMKMEHTITAPYAGTVATIHFTQGARVPEGSALLELTRQ